MTEPTSRAVGVVFHHISVRHANHIILDDVSAKAPPGGATVIIGPNGAGKTTLLRCLLSETPYSGTISFYTANGGPARPVISYVPQMLQVEPSLPLRVYEFLALGRKRPLWLGCSDKCRENGRRALAMVDSEKLESRRLGELSGGEMRRVLLASALERAPNLLILDEAEAGVDYRGERLFWELLDTSRRQFNFTLLMVSHNLPLAAHYATHVICLKERLFAEGAPREILTADNLQNLFGIPIHLYPSQCQTDCPSCPQCGAIGNLPHLERRPQPE